MICVCRDLLFAEAFHQAHRVLAIGSLLRTLQLINVLDLLLRILPFDPLGHGLAVHYIFLCHVDGFRRYCVDRELWSAQLE